MISTHIIEEAAAVFEEVIILKDGALICMENTEALLERAVRVNGLTAEVDAVTADLECHHSEQIGRSKTVTVLLQEGETLPDSRNVTVQPVSPQQLFVALCGEEGMG